MANTVLIKRGNGAPTSLADGELGFDKTSKYLYIGTSTTPEKLNDFTDELTEINTSLNEKIEKLNLLDYVYPIGSIYMSTSSTSPASFLGGTWEQIQNRFLLAAGSSYTSGNTGGAASHTLTTSEMPAHNHSGSTGSAGSHTHSGYTGSDGSHSHSFYVAHYSFDSYDSYRDSATYESWANGVGRATMSTQSAGSHSHSVATYSSGSHSHSVTIGSTGGGGLLNDAAVSCRLYVETSRRLRHFVRLRRRFALDQVEEVL